MDNPLHIETANGQTKYHSATPKEDQLTVPIYGTRKSSRRLNQINNSDHNFNHLDHHHSANIAKDANVKDVNAQAESSTKNNSNSNVNNQTSNQITTNSSANATAATATVATVAKQQRKWEQWQLDDTRWFFEALNENGKDFNAIHAYMTNRLKKKGVSEELMKNKEQIRCYFNRQWNKICSIFECNDENAAIANLDKTTKQLYALINYGEMWKKNNFKNDLKIDAKFKAHLNELVFKGYTFLKIGKKGKNVKLKTPLCKALKKIYYFETIYKSVNQNLPKDIVIELVPASNYAWMKVHSLAQNPRVRVKCSLQKRFSNLIKYLDGRWDEQKYNNFQIEALTTECLIKSPKNGGHHEEKSSVAVEESPGASVNRSAAPSVKRVFKVKPHPNHHRNLTGLRFTRIQPVPFNSQMDISLSAYLLKVNSKQQLLSEQQQQKAKRKYLNVNCAKKSSTSKEDDKTDEANSGPKAPSLEPVNSHLEGSNTSHVLETVRGLNLLNNIVSNYQEAAAKEQPKEETNNQNDPFNGSYSGNQFQDEKSIHLADPPPNATIAEWLSANITNGKSDPQPQAAAAETKDGSPSKETTKEDEPSSSKKNESQQDQPESIYNRMKKIVDPLTIKNGWSSDEIEDLTIGELYLMLKKPAKIMLQYDWSMVESNDGGHCSTANHTTNYSSLVSKLITAVTIEVMSLNKEKHGSIDFENECLGKNGAKNRKNKKLKTNHSADDHPQVEQLANNGENNVALSSTIPVTAFTSDLISIVSPTPSSNDHHLESAAKNHHSLSIHNQDHHQQVSPINQTDHHSQATSSTMAGDQFAVPYSPVPKAINKPANKNRIVNEQLLQEAKEQLNNSIKFNSARRNFNRKPNLMKQHPQQFQLNLNTNQLLSRNLCQLIANQGTALATVPVNVGNSTNGQTALISVITQVNQNGNGTPVQIIDGTNTIQFNNATTLNDLCTFVQTNCSNNNEMATEATNRHKNGNAMNLHESDHGIQATNGHQAIDPKLDTNSEPANQYEREFINQVSSSMPPHPLTSPSNLQDPLALSMTASDLPTMHHLLNHEVKSSNEKSLSNHSFNESCLKVLNDDKSVGFSNLLDISISDSIFNDSLPFPSDVSIESNFSTKDDQTLNTPIKLQPQKSSQSQFNLFDSSLGHNLSGTNRTDSFTDGWINNLGSDISLNNIFADSLTNDKKDSFNTNFDGVLNTTDRLNGTERN